MSRQLDDIFDEKNTKILIYLSSGLTAKEIAPKIFLSYSATIVRMQRLMTHYDARNHLQLVCKFKDQGYEKRN